MPFDFCKQCKKCCHVEQGYPPLEIPLLPPEKGQWKRIQIKKDCRYLGESGCELNDQKPYACYQYPLSFDPAIKRFYFDADCPLHERYQSQLKVQGSEARHHFSNVVRKIAELQVDQAAFLKRNFALDDEYFELLDLEVPPELLKPLKA